MILYIKEIYDDLKVYSVVYNPVGGIDRKYSYIQQDMLNKVVINY